MDQDITGDPHLLVVEDGSHYLQGGHNEASGKYVFPLMGGDDFPTRAIEARGDNMVVYGSAVSPEDPTICWP